MLARSVDSLLPRPPAISDGAAASVAVTHPIRTIIPSGPAADPLPLDPANVTGLWELRLGRVARAIVETRTVDGSLYLPFAPFLALAGIRHDVSRAQVVGWMDPAGIPFEVLASTGVIRLGQREGRGRSILLDGETIYVRATTIASLLGLHLEEDATGGVVTFTGVDALPVARRINLVARRERSGVPGRETRLLTLGPGAGGGVAALDYDLLTVHSAASMMTTGSATLAVPLGPGSLATEVTAVQGRATRVAARWLGVWPDGSAVRQLRLGDGLSYGIRPQPVRGLAVTNTPYARPLVVEAIPFAGSLPPDWVIEAYRGGELVGIDSAGSGGEYALQLPIGYGENPYELVAYSPTGEARILHRTFRALPEMLSAGQFEYGISAGQCREVGCGSLVNGQLALGASRRWTTRVGLQHRSRGVGPADQLDVGLVGMPLDALSLDAQLVPGRFGRIGLRFEPTAFALLYVNALVAGDSPAARQLSPFAEAWNAYGRLSAGSGADRLWIEGQLDARRATGFFEREARLGAGVRHQQLEVRPGVRQTRTATPAGTQRRAFASLDATLIPSSRWGALFGGLWLTAGLEWTAGGRLNRVETRAVRALGPSLRAEVGYRWSLAQGEGIFTAGLVSRWPGLRASSQLRQPDGGGGAVLSQSASGSFWWQPGRGAPLPDDLPSLDRGGIEGRVCLDRAGDGRCDADDPSAGRVRLLIGNESRVTGPDGRFALFGLRAYEDVRIEVDILSYSAPWWRPPFGAGVVRPVGNRSLRLDVPLQSAAIIEGRGEVADGGALPAGLQVSLIDSLTGAVRTLELYHDGGIYADGVLPGVYRAQFVATSYPPARYRSDTLTVHVGAASQPLEELLSSPAVIPVRLRLHPIRRTDLPAIAGAEERSQP